MKRNSRIFFLAISAIVLISAYAHGAGALDFFEQGIQKQSREDYFGASEDFQQALQINPSYGEAWFRLSEVTYAVGDYSLALSYLDSAEKFARGRVDVQNLRGMIYISLGRLSDARATFQGILKNHPNDIDARFGLAEIDLFSGSFSGARQLYLDALKRQTNNRKALLSLALLSAETGNDEATQTYINQALKYYSGDAEVHYLASYLEARKGNLLEAERRARAAVQINQEYLKAYVLLADILYSQKRYDDTIDVCEDLIKNSRKTAEGWYLKGLSLQKKGQIENAISTWSTALQENPNDEIMRGALELAVLETTSVEDVRRAKWAEYHVKKARDYAKAFMGVESRYEYQRALKLNPSDATVRAEFADLLVKSGLHETYLNQLKFIQNNQSSDGKTTTRAQKRVSNTIEAYDSLMKYSIAADWNIDPFFLDKTRWNVGIFYQKSTAHMIHPDEEEIAAGMAADIFSGISSTAVKVQRQAVSGYGEAFRIARKQKLDYFALLSIDDTEREISMDVVLYSGRTGTETTRFNYFRTGNDRFASILRAFRRDVLDMLPVRGKIVARSVNDLLVDLGKVEGMKAGVVLDVVKLGAIQTADAGKGVKFNEKDVLGKITITRVGEEISEGTLEQAGFYDRVNVGDEVLVRFIPDEKSKESGEVSDTTPAADENGNRILPEEPSAKKLSAEELGLVKMPVIFDLIRTIR